MSTLIGMPDATDHINRGFLCGDSFQWVREVLANAIEAQAKNVEFGVEWEAVEKLGVHRRMICDDGIGMTADEMRLYFRNIGKSGDKKVRYENNLDTAIHSNFGMGCRISLLPLNKAGLIYISYKNGIGSMIHMKFDEELGGFVVKDFDTVNDEGEKEINQILDLSTIQDWGDEEINWNKVAPDWIRSHGTCIVLLGNNEKENTFIRLGGDNKNSNRALMKYINTRFFDLSDIEVRVIEYVLAEEWPKNKKQAFARRPGKNNTCLATTRIAHGALHYLIKSGSKGKLKEQGIVNLEEGRLKIHWYLWEGDRIQNDGYAADKGYIAVKYRSNQGKPIDELFKFTSKLPSFRSFGISDKEVANNVTFILEPKHYMQDSQWGVFPDTSRNNLIFTGYGKKGTDLPIAEWGEMFIDQLPTAIKNFMKEVRSKNNLDLSCSDDVLKKIMHKINDRFKDMLTLVDPKKSSKKTGCLDTKDKTPFSIDEITKGKIDTGMEGDLSKIEKDSDDDKNDLDPEEKRRFRTEMVYGGVVGKGGDKVRNPIKTRKIKTDSEGKTPAIDIRPKVQMPQPIFKSKKEFEKPYLICSYMENYVFDDDTKGPAIIINEEADVIRESIHYHQKGRHPSHEKDIRDEVLRSFGYIVCSKVAHLIKWFKQYVNREDLKENYLSDEALTVSLLGYLGEDAFISPRLGKFGAKASKEEFNELHREEV